LGNGWLLPAGPLREPAHRLDRVDAIVLNAAAAGAAPSEPLPAGTAPAVPRFAMRLVPQPWRRVVDDAVVAAPSALPREAVHAIAGIANPVRFFDTLRGLGLDFVAHAFPDHHQYRAADLAWPGARAILMTEKDAVKCRRIGDDRMAWLPVRAEIDAALVTLIEDRMHGSQAA
jgi:tetraacyldisaccharide 4'-kinase